jgi:hypothetical protein
MSSLFACARLNIGMTSFQCGDVRHQPFFEKLVERLLPAESEPPRSAEIDLRKLPDVQLRREPQMKSQT